LLAGSVKNVVEELCQLAVVVEIILGVEVWLSGCGKRVGPGEMELLKRPAILYMWRAGGDQLARGAVVWLN
jgi:hypothetical protein